MKKTFLILFVLLSLHCFSQPAVDCKKLIVCFKQGARGNCASVALIKGSVSAYGINNVFSEILLPNSNLEITLKNGKKYTLTSDEISKAEKSADFKKLTNDADEIIKYAIKCYAVMAKVRQELEGCRTYEEALNRLERGAYTPNVYRYLGLETKVKQLKRKTNVSGKPAVVAWRSKHAVFCCNNSMDEHGKEKKLTRKYYGRFLIIP